MIISRTVNLTFENMPTHELVSQSGEISLGRVLYSKYKRANSIRNQWTLPNFVLTDTYNASSGFHANLSYGWFEAGQNSPPRNLFQSRVKSILGGSMKTVHEEIATNCKLNEEPATDRNTANQFCPYLLQGENIAGRIFKKVEKDRLIVKALVQFFSMNDKARKRLIDELGKTQIASLDLRDIGELFRLLKILNLKLNDDLTVFFMRVVSELNTPEKNAVSDLIKSKSNWKNLLKDCGNHTITITCNNPSKDFCEGNSLTTHFGLTVLFAVCLPGLIKGLSNVFFYKVGISSIHSESEVGCGPIFRSKVFEKNAQILMPNFCNHSA